MNFAGPRLLALCSAFAGLAALAGEPAIAIPVPPEFGVKRTGIGEAVAYSESVGELRNPIDRNTIEAQCTAARAAGITDKHPVFETGHDQPLKTENRRFGNERRWVNFSVLHTYQCNPTMAAVSSADLLCGCTYRVRIVRTVQIKKVENGRFENLLVDLEKGTASRHVSKNRSDTDPDKDAARMRALAPEVVGRDIVAGIPCVMRRQRVGADGWIDRCLVEDESKTLPASMRYRTLSEAMQRNGGTGIQSWSKAVKVALNATVDAGVFDLPAGVVIREDKR